MRRFALPLLFILLLGAAGFGVAQFDQVRKLRAGIAGFDKERADLRKRVWELQKLNADLAARLDRGARAPASGGAEGETADDEAPGPGEPGRRPRGRPDGDRFSAMFNNPEIQRLMSIQQKAGLDSRYASLFKSLNLSPADLEKFKDLLVEKQTAMMDVMAAARTEGLDPRTNRDEIRQLVKTTQAELDESIRGTLGDAAYSQYKSYEATLPQRGVVDQLGQRLSYSTTPLSDTQAEQLVQILASTAPAPANGNRQGGNVIVQALTGGNRGAQQLATMVTGGGARITDAAVTQAQGILSAPQLSALQSLQQEQAAAAQVMQQMRGNAGEGRRNNPGPAQPAQPQPAAGPGG